MTQVIQPGSYPTQSNTPTGKPFQIAVDNPYVAKDTYLNSPDAAGLGISTTSAFYTSGELDKVILAASSMINRYCRRWFDTQTIDEQKTQFWVRPYNPMLTTVVLANRPYQKINRIDIQVLKFFINVDISSAGYLQDFQSKGFYKIVPLLSSAGTGAGSPIPAAILNRQPLGVLWTNYTFGYGANLLANTLTQPAGNTDLKTFQAPLGNRLMAPSQTINVYKNGTLQATSLYTVTDYPNGIIVFNSAVLNTDAITADYTSNEAIPEDIRRATILLTTYLIGLGSQNPLGARSFSIQTYSVNWDEENTLVRQAKMLIEPFVNIPIKLI